MPSVVHVATPRNKKAPPPAVKQRREATSLRKFISFTRGIPDRKMAQWVRVTRVVKLRGPDNRILLRCETITEKPNTPPERGHYCSFMPADPKYKGKISECPALMLDCNCITGDTKVLTDKGWKTVQAIAEPRLPNHFPINYLVNGKIYPGSAPFYKGQQKVWEVCLDNGRRLTLTRKHKLRQYHGRKYTPQFGYVDGVRQYLGHNTYKDLLSWTRLKDLCIGDKLLLDTFDPIERKIKIKDFNEAFFIGVLMGDGSLYNTGQPCLELYKNTLTRRQDIIEGLRLSAVIAGDWDNNNGGTHISFNTRAKELMNRYRFVNKQSVKLRNFSQLMGYLSGLIITDGSVSLDNVTICGGKKYLEPLVNKLACYGFSEVSFIKVKRKGEVTNYGERKSDLWRLSLGSRVLRKIEKYLRVAREQHTAIGRICAKKAFTGLHNAKIISITYKGIRDVYDISVKKIRRFNANGIITKNCHRWLFVWEFAMWYRGAARLLRSNGDYPEQTNSLLRPGGCIAKGQLVSTDRGLIPIENVKVGDRAWTLQGWKKITATARTRRNAETIKINLLSGRQLILTPDHIIPCFDNKRGFVEVQAKDLRQRHSLIIAANAGLVKSINYQLSKQKISSNGSDLVYTTSKIKLSINLAELLGYMVAEGSVDKFHNTNNILIEDFAVKWRNIFGPNSCRTYEGGVNVGTRGAKILGHLGYNIGCYDKEVPSWIMQSSYKHIVAFLRGAYAGDGNFCVDQSTYATVSEKLARQMQLLLAIVGVNCYLDPYNSGVNNSKTWFLRTTDVGSTRKLFSILVPLRGYSLAPISDVAKSSLQDCLSNNYRRIFRKAIRKHLPKNDNTALVPLVDIKQYISYVPTLTWLAKWLTNKNLLFKQRLRAGGKPHNMARICDVANLALMRRRQIITIMRKLCVIKPSGSADRQRRFYAKRAWQRLKEILPQAAAELQPLIRDDILFDRVVNLEKSNKTDVYDMSVPGPDHFSVNAAIVHNCKHLIVGAEEILRKKL